MAININTVYDLYECAYSEWVGGSEPDDEWVNQVDFRFMYYANYAADRDPTRYGPDKSYLILIEPPKDWTIYDTDRSASANNCEVDNELSIYILRRGSSVSISTDRILMQYFENCKKVLLEYLDAVKYWEGSKIRIKFPANIDFVFDKTPNLEIGVHVKLKVTYS